MSIEKHLSDLTAAVTALTAALNQRAGATTVTQAAAPVAQPVQQFAPQPVIQQQMPTLPTFAAPVARPLPWPLVHPLPTVPA